MRDDGAGIDPGDIPKLFQAFSQLPDAAPRPVSGMGLGLYICCGIIEESGGRIGCESRGPGTGSTFSFTLPLAVAAVVAGAEARVRR